MDENKSDTPKRKHLVWLDGNEIKILDFGYDWHTNIKPQAIVRGESGKDGREHESLCALLTGKAVIVGEH